LDFQSKRRPNISDDTRQHVDRSSSHIKEGVEAGPIATKDTKNWQAGNEQDPELKDQRGRREPLAESIPENSPVPLFLKNYSAVNRPNGQDEKDEMEE
jgi:hypothetical protein